jgi:hypothetical protein
MRHTLLALVAISALAAAAGPQSAAAANFRYCLQGRETGYPGDCQYRSYAECQASASGRDAYCGINPRYAFARHRRAYRQQ